MNHSSNYVKGSSTSVSAPTASNQAASKTAARPCPSPMHIVSRPSPPRRRSSCSMLVRMCTPVAPMGWPSAMPVSLTLKRSASYQSHAAGTVSTCAAQVSLSSTSAMSSNHNPVRYAGMAGVQADAADLVDAASSVLLEEAAWQTAAHATPKRETGQRPATGLSFKAIGGPLGAGRDEVSKGRFIADIRR